MTIRKHALALVSLACLVAGCTGREPAPAFDETAWRAELEAWRGDYEERLTAPYGWLSLVGLDWLEPGESVIGSDPAAAVRLPAGVAPARVATLVLAGDGVRVVPEPGSGLTVDGAPAGIVEVAPGRDDPAPEFAVGDVRFRILRRGERIGVRSRWPRAATRTEFTGVEWYPVSPTYRLAGRLDRSASSTEIAVPNVLGDTAAQWSPGRVVFDVAGRELSLAAIADGPDDRTLFFVFRDATAGETTYPAGRFLYAELGDDDSVVVDFNRAYNPPCAWTRFATCPLPPPGNALDVRIEAGERYAGGH